MSRTRTSSWSSLRALGPVLRCAVILRSADWHEDGTFTLRCAWCGCVVGREVQVDHLIPRHEGGTDARDNLVPACASCNAPERSTLLVPQWMWREAARPITRELRVAARRLAEGWYPWMVERARKNREAQQRRDAARRERKTRASVRKLHETRVRKRREDSAYRKARSESKRAA